MMMTASTPIFLVLGQLKREYIITPAGKTRIDQPGGNALYAACGLALWGESPGLVSRVGEDYPQAWIENFQEYGLNTGGIRILPEEHDLRTFLAYTDVNTHFNDDPVSYFARLEMSFPKSLLGYKYPENGLDQRTGIAALSSRQSDLPKDYGYARAAHLCPQEYISHRLMPGAFKEAGLTTITLDPGPGYMAPEFWNDIPSVLADLNAFIPSEAEIRGLFKGRSDDLWEMAEALAAYGCPVIVIKRGSQGQMLFDADAKTRYHIPAYPARVADPTNSGDAFCGGFLAGYRRTFDPLQAALHGNVSASLAVEGSGPFYMLETLPGLAQARLETLPEMVRKA